ncbi:FAD-dependent oxidoreductase [Spirosoma flavum]|uniref:Flavin-dependent monooxygenase n=1 Tax=Spirosoma flavum TaxID=2048557 RepID=A0ABW6ASY8_9BACT
MIIQGKTIAIVGGGPGGLTLARLLQLKGADVQVYERDVNQDVRVQGATLDLHDDSGLQAIREAGLMDAFKANFRPGADKLHIMDKQAAILVNQHAEADGLTFGHEGFRPEIDRGPLRNILLDSLQAGTVVWNSYLMSLTLVGATWALQFQNGTSARADMVIAADGANSKIRPLITPIRPFYSGITSVEGTIYDSESAAPGMYRLVNGGKIFAFGDDKTLIISAKGDGSLIFYTGCKTDEYWYRTSGINFANKAQVLTWFNDEYAGWDPSWQELFKQADPHFVVRPLYCMPVDQTWDALPNLTMLGDAAHLMPPYAGEGVNMAMLDALELSQCLTSEAFSDSQSAIAMYENQMRDRAAKAAIMSLEQTDLLHSPEAISHMIEVIS